MPRVYLTEDEVKILTIALGVSHSAWDALGAAIYRSSGTKDLPSRNKPLAQGKPVKRSAKGKPAKAGVKARKGTRKK